VGRYLTVSDVAHALNVSKDSVRLYAKTGRLRARRTRSGIRLFAPRDVEQFKAKREQTKRQRGAPRTPTLSEGEE
jgi:excisionase family DNA binding protein